MTDYGITFADVPWESSAMGMRAKTVVRDGKRLRLVEFGVDFVEPDWCVKGHVGYVVSGAIEVDIAGTVQTFRAGDAVVIPSGEATRHRHHATLETATLFLVEDV